MLNKTNLFRPAFIVTLLFPFLAVAAENQTRWIFPNQTLPADIPYVPLRTGSGANDVKVQPVDWLLLKRAALAGDGRIKNVYGPTLNGTNAQVYYRIVSGMILQATMEQMGMKPSQAQIVLNGAKQAGKDFDSTPLSELGELPRRLDDLYQRWDQPMAQMSVVPYLVLPLATADFESSFQHFYTDRIDGGDAEHKCSNMNTVSPIAAVQTQIEARQKKLGDLSADVTQTTGLLDQSNHEVERLAAKVKMDSGGVEGLSNCLTMINDRVNAGRDMPSPACLDQAKGIMAELKMGAEWVKFTTVNLNNPKGDGTVKKEQELNLGLVEARLKAAQGSLADLQAKRAKAAQDLADTKAKSDQFKSDQKSQADKEASLKADDAKYQKAIDDIQVLNFKLERGTLANEMSESDVQKVIQQTPDRNKQLETLKTKRAETLSNMTNLQKGAAAMSTQLTYLSQQASDFEASLRSYDSQISNPPAGLTAQVADLQKQVADSKTKTNQAGDAFLFSSNITSKLEAYRINLSQTAAADIDTLTKERDTNDKLKKAQAAAIASRDTSYQNVQNEITALQSRLTYYRGAEHMGWFLETDCTARQQLDSADMGVFLSRVQMPSKTAAPIGQDGPVEGGKWGLFNMDYAHFQKEIESGALLNLSDYLEIGTQNSIKNLNFAFAQYMDPSQHCGNAASFSTSVLGLMGTAFAIWDEGSDDSARTKSNCAGSGSSAKQKFQTALTGFLQFSGGVLDQSLPKANSDDGNGLNERNAVSALTAEMRVLTEPSSDTPEAAAQRREVLVHALIRILAYDYDRAIANTRQFEAAQDIRMAGPVAASIPVPPPGSLDGLAVNTNHELQQKVRLFKGPIYLADYDTGLMLEPNQQVTILPIDGTGTDLTRAGWAHIRLTDANNQVQEGYVPVDGFVAPPQQPQPVAKTPAAPTGGTTQTADTGQNPAEAGVGPQKGFGDCPLHRLVTAIHGTVLTRVLPEIQTQRRQTRTQYGQYAQYGQYSYRTQSYWEISLHDSKQTTPANPSKTYVACEVFSQTGHRAAVSLSAQQRHQDGVDLSQTLAVRIVEVTPTKAQDGSVTYAPAEDYGGFISSWTFTSVQPVPRLELGAQLDPQTWSLKK